MLNLESGHTSRHAMRAERPFASSSEWPRPIKLDLVQAYVVYADSRNLVSAAEKLCLTPSAVCQKMRAFEAYFSQPLFEQKGRTKWLTDHGKLVYQQARRLLRESRSLHALTQGDRRATISVAVDPYLISARCRYWEWLSVTDRRTLEFIPLSAEHHEEVLQDRKADVVLSCSAGFPEDAVAIHRLHYGWYGHRGLLLESPVPIAYHRALSAEVLEPGTLFDSQFVSWKTYCMTSDYAHIESLVIAGKAIGLLPKGEMSASLGALEFDASRTVLTRVVCARPARLARTIVA